MSSLFSHADRALLTLAVLLMVLMLYLAFVPAGVWVAPGVQKPNPMTKVSEKIATYQPPPLGQFALIDEHPLFNPARKALNVEAQPTHAVATVAPEPRPSLILLGVVMDTEEKFALIKSASSSDARVLHLGDEISGWKLNVIEADKISLQAGGDKFEVTLHESLNVPGHSTLQAKPNDRPQKTQASRPLFAMPHD